MPAVLGVHRTGTIIDDLERWLGVDIFEIPTMLPAVTGLRLRESFESGLRKLGVQFFHQLKVTAARQRGDGSWLLTIGEGSEKHHIGAKGVVLASGRFLGNGLKADRGGIRETIFSLPVKQPPDRSQWHQKDLLNLKGHPINRAGLATDMLFRPVADDNEPIHPNLFAAGSILADQDWVRQKCGSGLAIATAFGAISGVKSFLLNETA
jgi:glycerol-3-phosphate dehydrogenase subunit B